MRGPGIVLAPSVASSFDSSTQDNLQLLLARRAELAKNKAKYTITETDAKLLMTHAIELHFTDGQTIVEAGHDISNVYRVKSGSVHIYRNGHQCCELKPGYFLGDSFLLYDDRSTYRMHVTFKANGPVVLLQLDLEFVRRMFSLDIGLSMKFYRLLATKGSSILHQLVGSLDASAICASNLDVLTDSASISDASSDAGSETSPSPKAVLGQDRASRRKSKRLSRSMSEAYKVYPLVGSKHGVQTARVKAKKIKIVTKSFGFQHKHSIDFAKLNTLTKIGDNGVTIIHQDKKVHTIFFKNYHDLEEFMYLVSSLTAPVPQSPHTANHPVSTPPALNIDPKDEEDQQVSKGEEHFRNIQISVDLQKGDIIFEEGDLYQRVYTLVSGTLAVYQKGMFLHYLTEGHVFGVDTILFLRPAPVTVVVHSESANLLIIPAYKMNELIDSDIAVAQKLFKRAAQVIDAQMIKLLQLEQRTPSRKSLELPPPPPVALPVVVQTVGDGQI